MAIYSTDADLAFRRPDILQLGASQFLDYHIAAGEMIERYVDKNWYRKNAIERSVDPTVDKYDPDLLEDQTQFKDCSVYLALSLIYEAFRKNVIEDGFGTLNESYDKKYKDEINMVLAYGIDYDWTTVEPMVQKQVRTLSRV